MRFGFQPRTLDPLFACRGDGAPTVSSKTKRGSANASRLLADPAVELDSPTVSSEALRTKTSSLSGEGDGRRRGITDSPPCGRVCPVRRR